MLNQPIRPDTGKGFAYWLIKIPEFVCLSVLWLICCIPVLTVIPASTALYDAVVSCTLGDEVGPFRRFFQSFKSSLLRGIPMSLLWGAVIFLYINTYYFALGYFEADVVKSIVRSVSFNKIFCLYHFRIIGFSDALSINIVSMVSLSQFNIVTHNCK